MCQICWSVVLLLSATYFSTELYRIYNIVRLVEGLHFNFLRKLPSFGERILLMFVESYLVFFHLPTGTDVLKVILLFSEKRRCHGPSGLSASQYVLKHEETFRTKFLTQVNCFSILSFRFPEASVIKGGNEAMPLHRLLQLHVNKRA